MSQNSRAKLPRGDLSTHRLSLGSGSLKSLLNGVPEEPISDGGINRILAKADGDIEARSPSKRINTGAIAGRNPPSEAAGSDRNLRLGILALQLDLVTREGLIAGLQAWALQKHRPLGEILVERDALRPADLALLDPMVDRHVASHGKDLSASLASLSSIDGVPEEITVDSRADCRPTPVDESANFMPNEVRYLKICHHADGGLGRVFVARDEMLGRQVALKEIKPRYADDPGNRARFLVEAEITGRLEHPGIVPVYGLGHYDDGRPYYAMKFIQGESLKKAIETFHADPSSKEDPGARTFALQKLLRRFLDVCNVVAYAHSRRVLHRDLKPSNIMLGRFGETMVIDWGLAKVFDTPDEESGTAGPLDDPEVHPGLSDHDDVTRAGNIIGTLAYMSPEVADGRLDLHCPAIDVYSLGATLYSILTGRPPFDGRDFKAIRRRVIEGDFPRPRMVCPAVPPALEAICLKAMSRKPSQRYPSATALADDLDRWMADQPVVAYPEPLTSRLRRWARRHRTAMTSICMSLVCAVCGMLIVTFLLEAQRRSNLELEISNRYQAALIRELETRNTNLQAELANKCDDLSRSEHSAGRICEALNHCKRAIDLRESLARARPEDVKFRRALGATYEFMGTLYWDSGQPVLSQFYALFGETISAENSSAGENIPNRP